MVKAEISQKSPLWASAGGKQQRPSARALSTGLFADCVFDVPQGSKGYVEPERAEGQLFRAKLMLVGVFKQAWYLPNLSLGPAGAFWGLEDTPDASENVVCDQFGADIPFISSWVCSTSAAFRNRAHSAGTGEVLSGTLYKGVLSPLRTRG